MRTFLKLCETLNYRKTAQILHMSQPSVTQHIQSLEYHYGCKLFTYDKRKLEKTARAVILETYTRSMVHNENELVKKMHAQKTISLRVGATKSIGTYVLHSHVLSFLKEKHHELTFIIDNTRNLLSLLETNEIDIAFIEGFFDKNKFGYKLMRKEPFVGICAQNHRFAGKEINIEDLFQEPLILREKGSGTRAIFEQELLAFNYTTSLFPTINSISSFPLLLDVVENGLGISFVFEAVAQSRKEIATFSIKDAPIEREFNYVFLKGTDAEEQIALFNAEEKPTI